MLEHCGDSITVTGELVDYNGLLEIQPVNNFSNQGAGYSINPQIITPLQIDENTESELVQIENVFISNGGSNFNKDTQFLMEKMVRFTYEWTPFNWNAYSFSTNIAYWNRIAIRPIRNRRLPTIPRDVTISFSVAVST